MLTAIYSDLGHRTFTALSLCKSDECHKKTIYNGDQRAISQRLKLVYITTSDDAGGNSVGRLIVNRSNVFRVRDSSGSLTKYTTSEAFAGRADEGRHCQQDSRTVWV